MKTAIITGVIGQDGSYLSEFLLSKGYRVIGIKRRSATSSLDNLENVIGNPDFETVDGDITDQSFIFSCINKYKPDEVYNLAAQSFVHSSFEQPTHTFHVDTEGVINILEAIRQLSPKTKLYQASTSEMFGSSFTPKYSADAHSVISDYTGNIYSLKYICKTFQDEDTPFIPQSPYAIAKLASHHMCRLYREAYGLHVSCGILFNHESPRRGKEFVTRKVTDYVARLHLASIIKHTGYASQSASNEGSHNDYSYIPENLRTFPKLQLGNLSASRDWGHAQDYVKAMWLMLQSEISDDYVVSTGETHTIEELCEAAFSSVGLKWQDYVEVNDKFKRPAEVRYLLGDSSKIYGKLGWQPHVKFDALIKEMVSSDIRRNL